MRRDPLPDPLIRFPVGSIVVWSTCHFGSMRHVPAQVVDRCSKRQGNARLHIRALRIGYNPFGEKVVYIVDKPAVGVANLTPLREWRQDAD